ncbi:3-dehydroquinate synthase [Dinghuibacter silviterrae]|uniref:3-dehydroquinate synthase n=1 Tax=Dinghuibacter silviterrae TaxID=1539049 RepID=A0A4R8DFY4_9BACT|nr:3-dehydroquinate synthase [Dinghuibacter silviterrae]TDW96523.1 3-dehydroquinate synthase [Dinghuibacter silviterrae]
MKTRVSFSNASCDYYFDTSARRLEELVPRAKTVLVTDEHVFAHHQALFGDWNTIVLKPGEQYKVQETVNAIIDQLLDFEADRSWWIVGVGGGVITDLTGYVAGIYMRGLQFGFIPTSILAMVDASIGGKNGIDVGIYKNMVGLIRQPSFLLYDIDLLKSLPESEWINGMAEVIKHACIKDAPMFKLLEENTLAKLKRDKALLAQLIRRNALLKTKVVQADEFEQGERKLLNFGHTLGHAIENMYDLPHGHAVSIGMTVACHLSARLTGFTQTERVVDVLEKYGLPTYAVFDVDKAWDILKMDKKRAADAMNYILLNKIGQGIIQSIPLEGLQSLLIEFVTS